MNRAPKVSCLMPHLPLLERFEPLKKSIASYEQQSYPNTELVVVLDEGPNRKAVQRYLETLERDDLKVLVPPEKRNLGQLRNLLWDEAQGDYICSWDDDDLHGPDRIRRQHDYLMETGADAVYLQEHYHFFPGQRELWWLNWRATEWKCLQGTVFARRALEVRYPTSGEEAEGKGDAEDTVLLRRLVEKHQVEFLSGAPELYLYVHHGTNLRDLEHHRMLATSLAISAGLIRRRAEKIAADVESFGLGPLVVMSPKGPGMTYEGPTAG